MDKASQFDPSLQALMMNADVDLSKPAREISPVGDRYQMLVSGTGWTEGADCGNSAGLGTSSVVGVIDTHTGQVIQVPEDQIVWQKDVKWMSDLGQFSQRMRDQAVVEAQNKLTLKSFYAIEKDRGQNASAKMGFDTLTTQNWRNLTSDSETAVTEFRKDVLPNRRRFIVDAVRNALGNATMPESTARALYQSLLTTFAPYLSHDTTSLTPIHAAPPVQVIHKEDEPQGLTLSLEMMQILQAIKNGGAALQTAALTPASLTGSQKVAILRQVSLAATKQNVILNTANGAINLTTNTLARTQVASKLSRLFNRPVSEDEVSYLLTSIQNRYPSFISTSESGKLGAMTLMVLTYLEILQSKNAFLPFHAVEDLPELLEFESGAGQNSLRFTKIQGSSLLTVTSSSDGSLTATSLDNGQTLTKSLTGMVSPSSWLGPEAQTTALPVGKIQDLKPMFPAPGAHNEYGYIDVAGKVFASMLVNMMIGNIVGGLTSALGLTETLANISNFINTINNMSNWSNTLQAMVNGQLQKLMEDKLKSMVPPEVSNTLRS